MFVGAGFKVMSVIFLFQDDSITEDETSCLREDTLSGVSSWLFKYQI